MNSNKELYSSAFTLSDMELFIFPDLLYAGVLANIISDRIWKWKEDPWFNGVEKLNRKNQLHRLKQYIIQNYIFNLDLETWGLTTQEAELSRFEPFISKETISESNALFGYQGDKYYFSLDIRKHFNLDKYDSNVIPYWKTETIEAMDAFKHKEGFNTGAGECVSLSLLYAAALFIVLEIPLEDIFLMATPLHSQNFIMINDGMLTNNRRIVTKNMWFNGTEISIKARRALMNEQITYISHISGHIHSVYEDSSIDATQYNQFKEKLISFLHTPLDPEVFINFLRAYPEYLPHFQFEVTTDNNTYYINAEDAYHLETESKNQVNQQTRKKLFELIKADQLNTNASDTRITVQEIEAHLKKKKLDLSKPKHIAILEDHLSNINNANEIISYIKEFTITEPKLPEVETKKYQESYQLSIKPGMTRTDIKNLLQESRPQNKIADLAFYAGRYCTDAEWPHYFKAAFERNPVCIEYYKDKSIEEIYSDLTEMNNTSIYSNIQFAQPDEVINYRAGDGFEKAVVLAAILKNRNSNNTKIEYADENTVFIKKEDTKYTFKTNKTINSKSFQFSNFDVIQ